MTKHLLHRINKYRDNKVEHLQILMRYSQTTGWCSLSSAHQQQGSLCHWNPNCSINKMDGATLRRHPTSTTMWCNWICLIPSWKTSRKIKHRNTGVNWHQDILLMFFKSLYLAVQCFYDFLFMFNHYVLGENKLDWNKGYKSNHTYCCNIRLWVCSCPFLWSEMPFYPYF